MGKWHRAKTNAAQPQTESAGNGVPARGLALGINCIRRAAGSERAPLRDHATAYLKTDTRANLLYCTSDTALHQFSFVNTEEVLPNGNFPRKSTQFESRLELTELCSQVVHITIAEKIVIYTVTFLACIRQIGIYAGTPALLLEGFSWFSSVPPVNSWNRSSVRL
jgi:hypothetical protein